MDDDQPDVVSVNRQSGLVIFDNGEAFEVTHWIDEFGEECDPEDAVMAVSPAPNGLWADIDLTFLSNFTVH